MSNRLTFSLASLILIFALAFIVPSAISHPGHDDAHPTVTIEEAPASAYAATQPKQRDRFKVKVSFSIGGSTDSDRFASNTALVDNEITLTSYNAGDSIVSDGASVDAVETRTDATKQEWIVEVNILNRSVRSLRFQVDGGAVAGNHRLSDEENEATSVIFSDLPPVLAGSVELAAAAVQNQPGRYAITFTFKDSDGVALTSDPTTEPTVGDIKVSPTGAAIAVNADGTVRRSTDALGDTTDNDGVYNQLYQLQFGATSATLDLISGYVTKSTSVTIPPPVVAEDQPPMATLSVTGLDKTARTFRLEVEFTPTNKKFPDGSDGGAGDAITVGAWTDTKDKDFLPGKHLSIKDAMSKNALIMVEAERSDDNNYLAILKYDQLSTLPLTVTIVDAFKLTGDRPSDGVGGDPTTPPVTGTPAAPTGVTATADQTADTVMLSWTAPTDTGGSVITGYTITQTGQAAASYTATASPFTTPKLAAGDYSFTVAATNATGTGAASAAVTATIDAAPVTPVYSAPTFPTDASVDPIVLWKGAEYQSGRLPLASHDEGDSVTYSFDPALPAGLSLRSTDAQTRFIQGTPTEAAKETTYKYTATSDVTSLYDTVDITLTVDDPVAPTAPTIVSAMEEGADATPRTVNTNKVVVTWSGPDGDFGAAVDGYMVHWTDAAGNTTDSAKLSATKMTFTTLTALAPGLYDFQVSASNSVDSSPKSAKISVLVANVPDRPTNLSAALVPNTKTVTLNWLAPEKNGGADITGYEVSVIDNLGTGRVRTLIVDRPVTTTTTPTLDPGQYIFRVAARNSDGLGMASDNTAPPTVVPTQPVDPANNSPTFGDASIASIGATVGMAITGVTLPAATDPDVGDTLYYSLSPTLPAGITFNANTRYLSGTPAVASRLTTYTYTVSDRRVGGKSASLQFQIQVMSPSDKQPVIDIPTVNDSSAPIDLGSRFADPVIPAHGWAVLVRDVTSSHIYAPYGGTWIRSENTSLPDLALFLGGRNGINSGTISLHRPAGAGDASNDVVISEIMWGVDNGNSVDPTCNQWIEFYNTTTAPIDLTGWMLTFHRSLVDESRWANADLIDIASNAGVTDRFPVHKYHHPWAPKGQSGIAGHATAATNIVSMYLDINYTQAANKKHEVPSGADGGHWRASVYPQSNLPFGIVGTPGAATIVRIKYAETPISQSLIINEIGNSNNDAYDWVEIYNPGTPDTPAVNIKNMMFTTVTNTGTDAAPVGKEEILFRFPNADINIKPGHFVVFAASDPKSSGNDLAAGIDHSRGDLDQPNKGLGSHAGIGHQADNTTAFYRIHSAVKLPNAAKHRLYILRSNTDGGHIGSHPDSQKNVVDVIGSLAIPLRNRTPAGWTGANEEERGRTDTDAASTRRIFDTTLWPLQWSTVDPDKRHPHAKRVDGGAPALGVSKVYHRNGKGLPDAENHLTTPGYTGVGYDRHAPVNAENHGTPGYANSVVGERDGGGGISALKDQVSISEIMLVPHEAELTDTGEFVIPSRLPRATKLPQWIEIYNSSLTEGVNIKGWKLEIQNTDQDEDLITRDLHSTLTIQENVIIPPNQTVLIVSAAGLNSGNFPPQRTINLFLHNHYRTELSLLNRNDPVLSQVGFHLELRDSKGRYVDAVGNLSTSTRRGYEPRASVNYDPVWDMPTMNHPSGPRTSLIRIYNDGKPNDGLLPVATGDLDKGTAVGWRLALDTTFNRVPGHTYYGNSNDYGTPGYRGGGPLPVSLSKFRPERLKATGEVVIRWITESELNNAGFNILRSETKDGAYTKINTQLIAGQGTTSERTTYEWKDTSAKPNVAYYYQIQDVSLDGKVTTLRVNRLKGNVNAAGKATTTWAELKALQ